jgi:DeoR/GlpR family transcriptional regulator of sugar metabolism
MTSSQTQSKVINLLRELLVATVDVLCHKLSTSRMTVLRALKSYG